MKKVITSALVVAGFISFTAFSSYAAKKCDDGYVFDEKSGKCIEETRGSFH
ncbi:MAG: hypothetical protein ACRBBN_09865 [Methyloligellaceae bacterium]